MEDPIYSCPNCGSKEVTAEHVQMFMVNSGEHYCHSVKTHDADSPSTCLDCDWEGVRASLVESTS